MRLKRRDVKTGFFALISRSGGIVQRLRPQLWIIHIHVMQKDNLGWIGFWNFPFSSKFGNFFLGKWKLQNSSIIHTLISQILWEPLNVFFWTNSCVCGFCMKYWTKKKLRRHFWGLCLFFCDDICHISGPEKLLLGRRFWGMPKMTLYGKRKRFPPITVFPLIRKNPSSSGQKK